MLFYSPYLFAATVYCYRHCGAWHMYFKAYQFVQIVDCSNTWEAVCWSSMLQCNIEIMKTIPISHLPSYQCCKFWCSKCQNISSITSFPLHEVLSLYRYSRYDHIISRKIYYYKTKLVWYHRHVLFNYHTVHIHSFCFLDGYNIISPYEN